MHSRILAIKTDEAQQRIADAVSKLAPDVDLDALAAQPVRARQPGIAQMAQLEAIADVLERLADEGAVAGEDPLPALLDEIETVEGVGPKTAKAIRDHFKDRL